MYISEFVIFVDKNRTDTDSPCRLQYSKSISLSLIYCYSHLKPASMFVISTTRDLWQVYCWIKSKCSTQSRSQAGPQQEANYMTISGVFLNSQISVSLSAPKTCPTAALNWNHLWNHWRLCVLSLRNTKINTILQQRLCASSAFSFSFNAVTLHVAVSNESYLLFDCRDLHAGRRRWYTELQLLMTRSFRVH